MFKSNKTNIVILFILSIITLTTSVFAWVSLSKVNKVGGIGSNLPDYTNLISFYVTRNDDLSTKKAIKDIDDMHEVFGNTKPGEKYFFEIEINNKNEKEVALSISLRGLKTIFKEDDLEQTHDLLRVFYIDNGLVNVNDQLTNDLVYSHQIQPISLDEKIDYDLKVLDLYRLENLTNSNEIQLIDLNIEPYSKRIVSFNLIYGPTSDIKYQDNMLSIYGIYILGQ